MDRFSNEDTSSLVDAYFIEWSRHHFSHTLQFFFNAVTIIPSSKLGLIDCKDLVLSVNASSYSDKVLNESDDPFTNRYSSPEADIG